jgi:hypothetical protein
MIAWKSCYGNSGLKIADRGNGPTVKFARATVNSRLLRGGDSLELHETPRGRGVAASGTCPGWAAPAGVLSYAYARD